MPRVTLNRKATPVRPALEQARLLTKAKSAILNSGDFLPANEVANLLDSKANKLNLQPNEWEGNREISSIYYGREFYLLLYGLNPGDLCPRNEMAEILNIFGDAKDGWGLAFWSVGPNSFLNDERPQDVLATDPEGVIAAAKDEMAELRQQDGGH